MKNLLKKKKQEPQGSNGPVGMIKIPILPIPGKKPPLDPRKNSKTQNNKTNPLAREKIHKRHTVVGNLKGNGFSKQGGRNGLALPNTLTNGSSKRPLSSRPPSLNPLNVPEKSSFHNRRSMNADVAKNATARIPKVVPSTKKKQRSNGEAEQYAIGAVLSLKRTENLREIKGIPRGGKKAHPHGNANKPPRIPKGPKNETKVTPLSRVGVPPTRIQKKKEVSLKVITERKKRPPAPKTVPQIPRSRSVPSPKNARGNKSNGAKKETPAVPSSKPGTPAKPKPWTTAKPKPGTTAKLKPGTPAKPKPGTPAKPPKIPGSKPPPVSRSPEPSSVQVLEKSWKTLDADEIMKLKFGKMKRKKERAEKRTEKAEKERRRGLRSEDSDSLSDIDAEVENQSGSKNWRTMDEEDIMKLKFEKQRRKDERAQKRAEKQRRRELKKKKMEESEESKDTTTEDEYVEKKVNLGALFNLEKNKQQVIKSSKNVNELPEDKRKRVNHILRELIHTEEAYVSDLTRVIVDFFEPLRLPENVGTLGMGDVMVSFAKVQAIKSLNSMFLEDLKKDIHEDDPENVDRLIAICKSFQKYKHPFKLYVDYMGSCEKYQKAVDKELYSNKKFNEFCLSVENRLKSEGVRTNATLESLLILPIQRLPRLVMLLHQITKSVSHEYHEREILDETKGIIEHVAEYCNQRTREMNSYVKLMDLKKKFGIEVNPHTKLLREGEADVMTMPDGKLQRMKLICTDTILIMQPVDQKKKGLGQKKKKDLVIHFVDNSAMCIPVDGRLKVGNPEIMVAYKSGDKKEKSAVMLRLQFDSPNEKSRWMETIVACIDHIPIQ